MGPIRGAHSWSTRGPGLIRGTVGERGGLRGAYSWGQAYSGEYSWG